MVAQKAVPDVVAREVFALVPAVILMLVLGVASPYWIRAIGGAVNGLAQGTARITNSITTTLAVKQ
jgi:NADH-quinone oxidoreductase subunit M